LREPPRATTDDQAPMKFVERRPFSDPEAAARKLMVIANSVEPVQDGRICIELTSHSCGSIEAARPNTRRASILPSRAAGCGRTKAAPI
jgi:hypothetical protein